MAHLWLEDTTLKVDGLGLAEREREREGSIRVLEAQGAYGALALNITTSGGCWVDNSSREITQQKK